MHCFRRTLRKTFVSDESRRSGVEPGTKDVSNIMSYASVDDISTISFVPG